VDFRAEGFKSGGNVNAHLEQGARERKKYLFSDREGRDVRRSDGRETFGPEVHVGHHSMEKQDQVVKVAHGRER